MVPLLSVVIARPFIFGIRDGAAYGLVAVGLVLIYKSSKVFNFAAGEFATIGAFATYLTSQGFDIRLGVHIHVPKFPFALAALTGIIAGLLFGLVTERLVVRPLSDRPRVVILVATAAVAITVIPVQLALGSKAFRFRALVNGNAFHLFGVFVSWQQVFVLLALAIVGVALAVFFR